MNSQPLITVSNVGINIEPAVYSGTLCGSGLVLSSARGEIRATLPVGIRGVCDVEAVVGLHSIVLYRV